MKHRNLLVSGGVLIAACAVAGAALAATTASANTRSNAPSGASATHARAPHPLGRGKHGNVLLCGPPPGGRRAAKPTGKPPLPPTRPTGTVKPPVPPKGRAKPPAPPKGEPRPTSTASPSYS